MNVVLGTVPYLNALPLHATLDHQPGIEIVQAIPAVLAPMLARGECEVALIPIVEHLRGVGEHMISNAGVGSQGPVESVVMFHRAPVETLTSIAVDASSRSSVALLRVLLHDGYGVTPQFVEHAPDLESMLRHHEATLMIGDPALQAAQRVPPGVLVFDLATEWKQLTGLPFIFAGWVTKRGLSEQRRDELTALLNQARDEAKRDVAGLVRATHLSPGVTVDVKEHYLTHAIIHHLTDPFYAGLAEFRRRAQNLGVI